MRITKVSVGYGETQSFVGKYGNVRPEVRFEAEVESGDTPETVTSDLFKKARTEVMRQVTFGLRQLPDLVDVEP